MKKSLVLIVLFLLVSSAFAETYKWTDEQGVLHFTDDLSKVPEKYRPKIPQKGPPEADSDKMPDYKVIHLAKLYLHYVCSLRSEETSWNEYQQEARRFGNIIQGLNMEAFHGINSFNYFKWREDWERCANRFRSDSLRSKLRIGMTITELVRLFEDYGYPDNYYEEPYARHGRYIHWVYISLRLDLYIEYNRLKGWY